MIINYYSTLLINFIKKNQPFSLAHIPQNDLTKFIEHRTLLAETEFEFNRKNGFDVVSSQESAIYVLFEGIVSDRETYFKSIIQENFPQIYETLFLENKLNDLIQKLMSIQQNLLNNSTFDDTQIKYELIAEIENLIHTNGI